MNFFLFPDIGNRLFDNAKIHKRFPAKEIDFTVLPLAFCAFDEQIDGMLSNIKAHKFPFVRIIITLRRKAVFAAQITVMGNIQAERFDNRFFFCHYFKVFCHGRKEHFFRNEFIQFGHGFLQFFFAVCISKCLVYGVFIGAVIDIQDIIGNFIDHVDNAAVDIEQHIRTMLTVFMNHRFDCISHSSSIQKEYPLPRGKGCPLNTHYFVQTWLPTVQDVLQADWQDVWHSLQPACCVVF